MKYNRFADADKSMCANGTKNCANANKHDAIAWMKCCKLTWLNLNSGCIKTNLPGHTFMQP